MDKIQLNFLPDNLYFKFLIFHEKYGYKTISELMF